MKTIEVELKPELPCPDCGTRGLHFCVGTKNYESIAYVGKRSKHPFDKNSEI